MDYFAGVFVAFEELIQCTRDVETDKFNACMRFGVNIDPEQLHSRSACFVVHVQNLQKTMFSCMQRMWIHHGAGG